MASNVFQNKGISLPNVQDRVWYEADIDYLLGNRGNEKILYSSGRNNTFR